LRAKFPKAIVLKVTRDIGLEDDHVSEQEWKDIKEDVLIENNDTIQVLWENVRSVIPM
jgi:hypothetical protein